MAIETKQLANLANIYREAVYGGAKKEAPKDTRLVVTAADKKANTPAYKNYKAGHKGYKAADHLKDDKDWGYDKKGNSLNPVDKMKKERKKDELTGSPNVKKEGFVNWRLDLKEIPDYDQIPVDAKKRNEKISEKNVKNTVKINPEMKEEVVDEWVVPTAKAIGKAAVRQGIKVGGKAGGKAVKRAGKEAVKAAGEVARETGRGVVDAAKKRGRKAGENFATNVGKKKEVDEGVAAPAKKQEGKGEKIGKTVGSVAGGVAGSAAVGGPTLGVGAIAGGVAGGVAGEKVGGEIGKKFDKKKSVKEGVYEKQKTKEVMGALKKRDLKKDVKKKIAADIVKKKGDTSKSDDRYAYEDKLWDEVAANLTELGEMNDVEFRVVGLDEAERSIDSRLDRKNKLMDKTVKKAMDYARREGEAAGHARYNMSRLGDERAKLIAKKK